MGRSLGYHSILVPLGANGETDQAVGVACRLASAQRARLSFVAVVEVPELLPLDAQMPAEEAAARRLLDRACATADVNGIRATGHVARGRDAATPIVQLAEEEGSDLIVIGAERRARPSRSAPVFGNTTRSVLKHAPCRTLVIAAPAAVRVPSAPEWAALSSSQPPPAAVSFS